MDGVINECEAWECTILVENAYRADNCECRPDAVCENPYECKCDGLSCDEVLAEATTWFNYYNN
jgi:hypothetical protein